MSRPKPIKTPKDKEKPQPAKPTTPVAPPSSNEEQRAREAAQRVFDLLRESGATGIEDLDPALAAKQPADLTLLALDRAVSMGQQMLSLLSRLEQVVQRLEAHTAAQSPPATAVARPVPVPTPGAQQPPQYDAGAAWARAFKDDRSGA